MRDKDRIYSVLELLNTLDNSSKTASKIVNSFFRSNKFIGSKDRKFISNIFSTDLDQFYNMMYIFLNTVTPGSDRFFKMSPVESRILMNHHNKKIKEENDRLAKEQRENN